MTTGSQPIDEEAPAAQNRSTDNHDDSRHSAGTGDEFFSVISSILSCMESAVEVLRAAGEEDRQSAVSDRAQWRRPQLSAVSKKRLMTRTISNLTKGIQELSMLKKAGEDLQQHYLTSQLQHSAAERSRQEIYMQLHHISGNMHETGVKLHRAEAARVAALTERDAMQTGMDELRAQVDQLQQSLNERDQQVADANSRLQEQESTVQEAKQQCEAALQEAADAVTGAQTAEARAAECEAALEKCKLTSKRNQEAVGKITADNLMLVMRLKKAEKEVAELSQERDVLKAGFEKQEGPWFETVKAGVEQQVSYAMARATELEAILERTRLSHTEQLERERAALEDVEGKLEASKQHGDRLQHTLHECQADLTSVQQAFADAQDEIRTLRAALESTQAEVRVLSETVKEMRHECQEAAMRVSAAVAAESAAKTALDNGRAEKEELKIRAERVQSALDAQTEVNKQLMTRKSEIEWQLMTALASVPSQSSVSTAPTASDPEKDAPVHVTIGPD